MKCDIISEDHINYLITILVCARQYKAESPFGRSVQFKVLLVTEEFVLI